MYEAYIKEQIKLHVKTEDDFEDFQDNLPEIYQQFINQANEELMGKKPIEYFNDFLPEQIFNELIFYCNESNKLPDLLLDVITDRNEEMAPIFLSHIDKIAQTNVLAKEGLQLLAIDVFILNNEYRAQNWYFYCIESMLASDDRVAIRCSQALFELGLEVMPKVLYAMDTTSNSFARESYADILSKARYQPALESIIRHFETEWEHRAVYASCLSKMGAEALPTLEHALKEVEMSYLDYLAIRDAYEMLGGQLELERDFETDADYRKLANDEVELEGEE